MRRPSPEIMAWLEVFNQRVADLAASGFKPMPADVREGLAQLTRQHVTRWPDIPWVRDDTVEGDSHGIPVRIFHPEPGTALPVLVYLHGGGHMAGSVTVYDPICRKIALGTRHLVVSVEYRLAPEFPYPAAVEDAWQVTRNVWTTLEAHRLDFRHRLAICGDSGGGALCATLAHRAQEDPTVRIRRQVLIYPSLDYTLSSPSVITNGKGYFLEREKIGWYFDNYFRPGEDRKAASPLFMPISRGIPSTLVVTAGFCPLRDEAVAYVAALRTAGVDAQRLHFNDMIHAFLNLEDIAETACRATYDRMDAFLNA